MNKTIEKRVRTVLTAEADRLAPDPQLAAVAIRRGRRGRRVRRAGLTAVVTAAVVAAVAVPTFLARQGGQEPAPAPTKTPSGPALIGISKWVAELPEGPAPTVPYAKDGFLRDGQREVRLPDNARTALVFGRVDGGWFAGLPSPTGRPGRYGLLREDGTFTSYLSGRWSLGASLSPDGKQAVIGVSEPGKPSRIIVLETATGTVVDSLTTPALADGPPASNASVRGWNSGGIWLNGPLRTGDPAELISRWLPGTEPVRTARRSSELLVNRTSNKMVETGGTCQQVLETSPSGSLALADRECIAYLAERALSPDGRVLMSDEGHVLDTSGAGRRRTDVPDLMFGEQASMRVVTWEDPSHPLLLFASVEGDTHNYAAVRCDLDSGDCQRVLEQTVGDPDDGLVLGSP